MATSAEVIERLARDIERLRLLDLAKNCETLDEFIQKLEGIIEAK